MWITKRAGKVFYQVTGKKEKSGGGKWLRIAKEKLPEVDREPWRGEMRNRLSGSKESQERR